MPIETAIVVGAILAAFTIFAATLAWVSHASRTSPK
jgi:hypothetical protein